jgi:hypothetical protein
VESSTVLFEKEKPLTPTLPADEKGLSSILWFLLDNNKIGEHLVF